MDRAGATETHIEFVKVPGNKVTFENLEVATPTGCTMLSKQYVEIALEERLPSKCRIPLRIKRSQIHILLAAALPRSVLARHWQR